MTTGCELRDLRMAVEGLATEKAAAVATRNEVAGLRRIADELLAARSRGDFAADRAKIREFHFTLSAIARQPALQRVVEGLWLQTGPYLNLLYPDYASRRHGPARRLRLIEARDARHGRGATRDGSRHRRALTYVASLADLGQDRARPTGSRQAPAPPASAAPCRRHRLALIEKGNDMAPAAQQSTHRLVQWQKFMPEGQVMIPFRDRSWKYGDGAFDMTRTFEGKPFRLKEHIDRFYRRCATCRSIPASDPKEMVAHSEEVVARNEHLRPAVGDWWVGQRVSRGVDAVGDEGWEHTGPNVVIEVLPLPLAKRAPLYRDGAEVITTTTRRTAPRCCRHAPRRTITST